MGKFCKCVEWRDLVAELIQWLRYNVKDSQKKSTLRETKAHAFVIMRRNYSFSVVR